MESIDLGKKRRREKKYITCSFVGINYDVEVVNKTIEPGKTIYWSEMFRIELIERDYIARLRKNICIQISEDGTKFEFVPSQTEQNPPVILGSGSFGIVFKIIGTDGKWYVVKSFDNSKSACDEWTSLQKVSGKHKCIQLACGHQIDRDGDLKHIIVSEYQGDITLSSIGRMKNRLFGPFIGLFWNLSYGLDKIHEQGLIHGDIKSDNILCITNPDGTSRLIIIDFGLANKIGKQINDANSYYAWWFRYPIMFLSEHTKSFPFIKPIELSSIMDWWAFFVTMLHILSDRTSDFLGFRTKTEVQARQVMSETSPVLWLMKIMNGLGKPIYDISFVQQIYFILFNKEGQVKFDETFKSFGFTLDDSKTMYVEYVEQFHNLRDKSPIIGHVNNIFDLKRMRYDDPATNISGILDKLSDLFVEILRDGADLSLLNALTIEHVEKWFQKLEEILKIIDKMGPIYF